MFATANSKVYFHITCRWLLLPGSLALASTACADSTNTGDARFVAHAREVFSAAQKRFETEPTNTVAACEFAHAAFDVAEFATNDTERATLAVQGIAACRGVLAHQSKSAPAHYYLAMNLGQLARTKTLGALKIVDELEREFKMARVLDEHLDFAGPDRGLGLLYRDAPGWPVSIGNRSKARHHLRRAAELAPQHPENHLCLLEACLRWGDRECAEREIKILDKLWPVARKNLVGENWMAAWADWESRLSQAKAKFEKLADVVTSPHSKD